MKSVVIYGASGHSKVIIETIELLQYKIKGVVDDNPDIKVILGYRVDSVSHFSGDDVWVIGVGNNFIRQKIVKEKARKYTCVIHPASIISHRSSVAEGTVVMAGVTINSDVEVGSHCIINTNASIDHDCTIEDYVHISPNVALAGNVKVGEGTHIGIGACVIQGVKIGKWCTIGAGAVIIRDVPDGATVVGNPGKIIRQKSL